MRQLGIFQIFVSGFCFGFLGIFGKLAYTQGVSPGVFLALRFLLAAALLFPYLFWRKRASLAMSRTSLLRSCLLGALGYAIFSSFYFFALEGLSASLTVLLLYTYPVIVSLGAWIFFRERLLPLQLVALPITLAGLALLVWAEIYVQSYLSLAFGLCAALFYSAYILVSSHHLKSADPVASSFYIILAAGVALALLHLRPANLPQTAVAWGAIFGAATLGTVVAITLFLAALKNLSSGEVSLLSTLEPVTGVALAGLLLGEALKPWQWFGGGLVLLGMVLVSLAKRKLQPILSRIGDI